MKKLTKLFAVLLLALSLAMLVSCGDDDDDKDDEIIDIFDPDFWGEGVEGPIIPYE